MSNSNKKISFNTSTLFSLKAEVLRKQEEVSEKKRLPQHRVESHKPPSAKSLNKHETSDLHEKSFKENLKSVDTEELDACRKAKQALERKAELYEHLADNAGRSELAGRFLVDFDSKKKQSLSPQESESKEELDATLEVPDDDDEWTEFTDCLGRTRKCLKTDVDYFLKKDKELLRSTQRSDSNALQENHNEDSKKTEKPFLVQKTNDYLLSLREKWEQKEKELLGKDKDIHYQDLLFDEARIHGVGYYSFSTDETERKKQMEELMKSHEQNLAAQKKADEARNNQEQLLAARVAATRASRRLRAGLPPEEPKDDKQEFTEKLLQLLQQQRDEAENKAKEKEKKIREEQERERQKLREAHVRDWDIGKDGVNEKLKKFREMTQEEYVEQQRSKRIDEFAPLQASCSGKSNAVFDEGGRMLDLDKEITATKKNWDDVRQRPKTPPPPTISDLNYEVKGIHFATTKKMHTSLKYKNFVKATEPDPEPEPIPIVNELSDEDDESNVQCKGKRKYNQTHTEIAPPPTYDYYGPTPKQFKSKKPFNSDIREAYAQGVKSLETKPSERKLPSHYDFTFD